ncbi:MAG: hypothetical protein IKA54_04980 [Clostridia bacterium]|nr:hypothetical protein [Clostridia bacterium]
MKTYEIIVLGSGFTSLGIASKYDSTLIIENKECLDVNFYEPYKSYKYTPFTPTLKGSKRLNEIFNELNLFDGDRQNVNGFDVALCNYAKEIGAKILIRTVVVSIEKLKTNYKVTVYNNGGIKSYFSKRVIDTRSEKLNASFTVLFVSDSKEIPYIEKAFNGKVYKAFYDGWYALKISAENFDINDIKVYVYDRWKSSNIKAKILSMPTDFCYDSNNPYCDGFYLNPIEAFEVGESL